MGLLDQLLGLSGANSGDWVSQMQQQMSGGPLVGPAAASGGSSMVGAQRAMPGSTPPQAGQRKMFPAPDAPKMDEGPTMKVGGPSAAAVEEPGVGTYLKGAMRGFGGDNGGFGILGAIGGAMNAGDQVTKQNELYQTLTANGVEPRTAQLLLKQPEAYKVIESLKAQRQKTQMSNQTAQFLADKFELDPVQAQAIAQDPELLRKYLQPGGTQGAFTGPDAYKVVDGRLVQLTPQGPQDVTPERARPKIQDRLETEQFKNDVKTVDRYITDADSSGDLLNKIGRLKIARDQTTREGPVSAMLPSYSPEAQQVDSASTEIQLEFTKQTKGAITEREMSLFKGATPGWQMTDAAAGPVLQAMELAAERTKEKAAFFDAWLRTHQSLKGAQSSWNAFIEDKPIIQKDQSGKLQLAPENLGAWQDYLAGKQASGGMDGTALQGRGTKPLIDQGGFKVEYE
jgi:hypothetical protein